MLFVEGYPVGAGVFAASVFGCMFWPLSVCHWHDTTGRTRDLDAESTNRDIVLYGHFTMPVALRSL
jgi:hypothetical protein